MEQNENTPSRKNFLFWGAAIISSLTAFRFITRSKKTRGTDGSGEKAMVKMLGQDGKLVEVDIEKIYCGKKKKITDEQLKTWVNKK